MMRGNSHITGTELIQMNNASSISGMKVVHYNDTWEQYQMCFTIWHPIDDSKEDWIFENNKTSEFEVSKIPRQIEWMDVKYGKTMQPVKVTMKMDQ